MHLILIVTHWLVNESIQNIIEESKPYGKVIVLSDLPQYWLDVEWKAYHNEWFDFCKLYRFFREMPYEPEQITIINETVSLIDTLEPLFKASKDYEYYGATDWYVSLEYTPQMKETNGKYIQWSFYSFRGKAIELLRKYFRANGLIYWKEEWVLVYELLLTKYMQQNNIKMWVYLSIDDMMNKYWWYRYDPKAFSKTQKFYAMDKWELNGYFAHPKEYAESGLPFIKNSIFKNWFKKYDVLYWLADNVYNSIS